MQSCPRAQMEDAWSIMPLFLDTTQLRPPAMPWKHEHDITPEFANEIWSGIESVESFSCSSNVWRYFFHAPAQDSNLA